MSFRKILAPFSLIWWLIMSIRNLLYGIGLFPVKKFKKPIIVVGNLSTGGTGKTPHTVYVLDLLRKNYSVASLSRGYGRRTKGFITANYDSNAREIGDEPMLFFNRFKNRIVVSVGEDRVAAVKKLLKKFRLDAVVLDDAFQHRKLKAGLNILLTEYANPYSKDYILPMGNLREPRSGAKRAKVIVVTKCPKTLTQEDKDKFKKSLKIRKNQFLFFSKIVYSEELGHLQFEETIGSLKEHNVLLITGIANSKGLLKYVESRFAKVNHLKYPDHYDFKPGDIKEIDAVYEEMEGPKIMLTTEKDYMRLKSEHRILRKLYYLPISIEIDDEQKFNSIIKSYVQKLSNRSGVY